MATPPNDNAINNLINDKKIIVFPYIKRISEMISSVILKSEHTIGYRCLNKLSMFVKRMST